MIVFLKANLKHFLQRIIDVGPVFERRLRGDLIFGLSHFLDEPTLRLLELAGITLEERLLLLPEAVLDEDHRAERHVGQLRATKHSVVFPALLAELGRPLLV